MSERSVYVRERKEKKEEKGVRERNSPQKSRLMKKFKKQKRLATLLLSSVHSTYVY